MGENAISDERLMTGSSERDNLEVTTETWQRYFFACDVSAKDLEHMARAFLPECFFFEKLPEGSVGRGIL